MAVLNQHQDQLQCLAPCWQVSVWQGIVMTVVDGTYSAFLVPISIAFSSDLNHWSWTTIVDVVAGAQHPWILALLRILTGYMTLHTGCYWSCHT